MHEPTQAPGDPPPTAGDAPSRWASRRWAAAAALAYALLIPAAVLLEYLTDVRGVQDAAILGTLPLLVLAWLPGMATRSVLRDVIGDGPAYLVGVVPVVFVQAYGLLRVFAGPAVPPGAPPAGDDAP